VSEEKVTGLAIWRLHGMTFVVRRLLLAVPVIVLLGFGLGGSAAGAPGVVGTHTWHVSLKAPADLDLSVAELRFSGRGGSSLRLSLTKAPGLYYAAGGLVVDPTPGGPRAIVVLVNERPKGSKVADRSTIGLDVSGSTGLGAPVVRQLVNPFALSAGAASAARLCGLGGDNGESDLRVLLSGGHPLAGFRPAHALIEAYDVACGLAYNPLFAREVTGCGTSLVAGCCPPNAMCAAPVQPPVVSPTPTPAPPAPPTPTPAPPTPTPSPPTPVPTPIPSPPICSCPSPPVCGPGEACPLYVCPLLNESEAIAC
jgi:hypothetical protein